MHPERGQEQEGTRQRSGASTGQGEDPGILGVGEPVHERDRGQGHWTWDQL